MADPFFYICGTCSPDSEIIFATRWHHRRMLNPKMWSNFGFPLNKGDKLMQ